MARIILESFIKSISGKVGNMYFKTYANGRITMTTALPSKRSTPCSEAERKSKQLFAKRAAMVRKLKVQFPGKSDKELWTIVKQLND